MSRCMLRVRLPVVGSNLQRHVLHASKSVALPRSVHDVERYTIRQLCQSVYS